MALDYRRYIALDLNLISHSTYDILYTVVNIRRFIVKKNSIDKTEHKVGVTQIEYRFKMVENVVRIRFSQYPLPNYSIMRES